MATTPLRRRITVFDKDGLTERIPAPDDPPPATGTIEFLIQETLRQAANFPVVIVRQDWLMGVIGVEQVQLFLYQLFAESNKPTPPTGPKQWSAKLTADQRRELEELPVPQARLDSVLAAREAAFRVFFRHAPGIARRNGVEWPADLERAVRAYLERENYPLPDSEGSAGPA